LASRGRLAYFQNVPAVRSSPRDLDVYGVFGGPIDQNAIERFFRSLPRLTKHPRARVHLLFQTVGGYVGDGVCLYNFFRTFPRDLIVYNAGNISSIGVIAYLGAARRRCSASATFRLHRSTMTPDLPTASRLQAAVKTLAIDDDRTSKLLRRHLTLTDDQWHHIDRNDLTLPADEALQLGLVHEIADFSPPKGATLYAIV
jgi:ATP-dependent Clp protease protease subunit